MCVFCVSLLYLVLEKLINWLNRQDMEFKNNNKLANCKSSQLCEMHNVEKTISTKDKLIILKSYDCAKDYRPLKNKKIKLHKLRFIKNSPENCDSIDSIKNVRKKSAAKRAEKKQQYQSSKKNKPVEEVIESVKCEESFESWSNESSVMQWLKSIKVPIKKVSTRNKSLYLIQNRICSFYSLIIFANKIRVSKGLEPFYVDGITEC